MQFLVTTSKEPPFRTDWYNYDLHFNEEAGMVIYDLLSNTFTVDGKNWNEIKIDLIKKLTP